MNRLFSSGMVAAVAISLTFSSCTWWGEDEVKPQTLVVPQQDNGCPDFTLIFSGTESESIRTFGCWAETLNGMWDQIEGEKENELTNSEIGILVHRGVLKLTDNPQADLEKLLIVKRLLGFPGNLTKEGMTSWLSWFRTNRKDLKRVAHRLNLKEDISIRDRKEPIFYSEIREDLFTVADLLKKIKWKFNSEEIGQYMVILLEPTDPVVRQSIIPLARLITEFMGSLCPGINKRQSWDTEIIAECIVQTVGAFESGEEWFNFMLNPVPEDFDVNDINRIESSLESLHLAIQGWFENYEVLQSFRTKYWVDFSRIIEAAPVDSFTRSFSWISQLDPSTEKKDGYVGSNPRVIRSRAFIKFFEIVKYANTKIMHGIPEFLKFLGAGKCKNASQNWRDCELPIEKRLKFKKSSPLNTAVLVWNPAYGNLITPPSGGEFVRMMFFDSLSHSIIDLFDKPDKHGRKDGIITTSARKSKLSTGLGPISRRARRIGRKTGAEVSESDEVINLIRSGVEFVDHIDHFISNVNAKLEGRGFVKWNENLFFHGMDLEGLARVVTVAGSVINRRKKAERNYVKGLLKNLTNINPNETIALAQPEMTSILYLVDSLPAYRSAFLAIPQVQRNKYIDLEAQRVYVNRADALAALPDYLRIHFPRTYRACMRWRFGYRTSCGLAYEEILAGSDIKIGVGEPGTMINSAELDIIPLVAIGLESMLDSCDANKNGRLELMVLNGENETSCAHELSIAIATRLLHADVLNTESEEIKKRLIKIMALLNHNFLFKLPGEVSLIHGYQLHEQSGLFKTLRKMGHVILTPLRNLVPGLRKIIGKSANLGSMYSLLSNIANIDKWTEAKSDFKSGGLKNPSSDGVVIEESAMAIDDDDIEHGLDDDEFEFNDLSVTRNF